MAMQDHNVLSPLWDHLGAIDAKRLINTLFVAVIVAVYAFLKFSDISAWVAVAVAALAAGVAGILIYRLYPKPSKNRNS